MGLEYMIRIQAGNSVLLVASGAFIMALILLSDWNISTAFTLSPKNSISDTPNRRFSFFKRETSVYILLNTSCSLVKESALFFPFYHHMVMQLLTILTKCSHEFLDNGRHNRNIKS